jgi:hypothetical protein
MRRSSLLLGSTLLGVVAAPLPHAPARASCAGPYLEDAEHLVLTRGTTAMIEGRAFSSGCSDSIGCSTGILGCQSCTDPPPVEPMEDVELALTQGDRTWRLAVADAGSAEDDRLGWVTWTFEVPSGAKPGPARLVVEYAGRPVGIRID